MLWSKLKNVILAVLLLANAFLLILVWGEAMAEDGLELEGRTTALAFLAERGIVAQEGNIPRELGLSSQQVIWDREQELAYAQALLGEVAQEFLGGEIVRYYNGQGELRFHGNGEFYGSFAPGFFQDREESREEQANFVMKTLGYQGRLWEETEDSLSFVQEMEGVLLLGCASTFLFEDGFLVEISQGKRLEGEFVVVEEQSLLIATALMQFYHGMVAMEADCSEIYDIEPCYLVSTPLTSAGTLTPSWFFQTDVGLYVLDSNTGLLLEI